MNDSFLTVSRTQLKIIQALLLFLFVSCEMFLPVTSWAQAFSDTGTFSFTGSSNPVFVAQKYREFLPGEGVKVGPARLHPFLGVAEVWTDNVFRRNKGPARESDFLTTIAPGFQASFPLGGKHSFLLDYRAAQFLYSKFSGNNALTQNGVGHLALDYPGGLRVDVDGNFIGGFDARGSEVDTQQSDITKWNSNTIRTTVQLSGANLGVRGGLRYTQLSYRNNGQAKPRNRSIAAANFTIFVPTSSASSALLGGFVSDTNYERNNQLDSFTYGVFTGFRIVPTRQFSGELNVGYNILNFDRAPERDGTLQGDRLLDNRLALGGKQQKALFVSGNLRWRPTPRLSFVIQPFRSIQQAAVVNTTTFTQTGGVLRARQTIQKRIELSGSLSYSNSDFEGGRSDNQYRVRTELSYRTVKWLGFRLAYIYSRRFSSETNFRFYSNTIMLSVQGFL